MREIILDGEQMKTKGEMHDCLIENMQLPYYYSRNLDSLWSILLKETDPVRVTVVHPLSIALGYGEVLLELLQDLAGQNTNYEIVIVKE